MVTPSTYFPSNGGDFKTFQFVFLECETSNLSKISQFFSERQRTERMGSDIVRISEFLMGNNTYRNIILKDKPIAYWNRGGTLKSHIKSHCLISSHSLRRNLILI